MTYAQIWERAAYHLGKFARVFYQVTLYCEGSNVSGIHALNLSQEFLESRVLAPYRRGKAITLKGRTIECSNIARICIMETAEEHLQLEDADYYLLQLDGFTYSTSERDVTDELIVGPPGYEVEVAPSPQQQPRPMEGARDIFVVHGRNLKARDALFDFLRAIDLHPLEWSEAVQATGKASPYIGEILDAAFSRAHAVIVLMTPDDEARLSKHLQGEGDPPHETELIGQARPNVLFEAGMAMAGNQDRTVLVELGRLRPFSDVAGRHVIRLDNSSQRRQELAQRLKSAGCPVNLDGIAWHNTGDFESAIQFLDEETSNPGVNETREAQIDEEAQLSEDAKELLIAAALDPNGMILKTQSFGGIRVQTNGKQFADAGNRRSEAKWEQAIEDLFEEGLIDDPAGTGSAFKLTHRGFQLVDQLANQG